MPPQSPIQNNTSPTTQSSKRHAFLITLIVLMLLSGGFATWYFLNQPLELEPENLSVVDSNEFADWKTYRNEECGFEFKYPKEYEAYENTNGVQIIRPEDRNVKGEPVERELSLILFKSQIKKLEVLMESI